MYYEIRRIEDMNDEVVDIAHDEEDAMQIAMWWKNREIESESYAEIRIEAYETEDDAYDDKVAEVIDVLPDHVLEIKEV